MKIISKFKDYYDGVSASFPEDTPVFIRTNDIKHDLVVQDKMPVIKKELIVDSYKRYCRTRAVGFCGKVYVAVHIRDVPIKSTDMLTTKEYYCYDLDEADELIFSNVHSREKRMWNILGLKKYRSFKELEKDYQRHFSPAFDMFQVPTFVSYGRDDEHLILNPCLKDYQFFKKFDAYQAYQELDMYIGNVLTNTSDPEMPVGDDVVVAESKGFNKFSFRKDKGKKRKLRNKKGQND